MFKSLPPNIKIIISSSAPLVIVVVLSLLVGNFGISKISDIRSQIDDAQNQQNTLTQKLNVLQSVAATLGTTPDLATNALPSANSALVTISQLKNLAGTNSVTLSNIKSGSEVKDTSGLSRADISFDALGTRDKVVSFLKAVKTFAPVALVDNIKMNENGGSAKATVAVKTFWAPLPKNLPAVDATLSDLTPGDKTTVASISALIQPTFLVIPPAPGGKSDPFSP